MKKVPKLFFNFLLDIINQALEPFQNIIKTNLEHNPNIENNKNTWKIITYTISFFYVLILMYSGFLFIVSGNDVIKRDTAKEWLRNILVMLILIQASFYLYEIILELGSSINTSILNLIPDSFFQINSLNYLNFGVQLILALLYLLILLLTALFLVIRIIFVFFGVVLFPIGIFLYFIPPLNAYGRFFIHLIMVFVFSTVLASLILLTVSNLLASGQYTRIIKTLIIIGGFVLIDLLFIALGFFIITHSSLKSPVQSTKQTIKYYKNVTNVFRNKEAHKK